MRAPHIVPTENASVNATAFTGGGDLYAETNSVIPNSAVTYVQDAIGRTINRSIDGASNPINWTYDKMSRVLAESNLLGTFNFAYVDDTPGSSKGVTRLASISYPNSQVTNFKWYPTTLDERLQQIKNLAPNASVLSQFDYAYNAADEITQWQQQQNGGNIHQALEYDAASQLITAQHTSGSVTTATVVGTKTTGDVLTITAYAPTLTNGQQAVSYTVQAGDTVNSIASGLASAINGNANLQAIGVTASASSILLTITAPSTQTVSFHGTSSANATATPYVNASKAKLPLKQQNYYAYDAAANRIAVQSDTAQTATIGGTVTAGNVVTLTVFDSALSGGQRSVNYTVQGGDTLNSIATGLAAAVNGDAQLQAINVSAAANANVVTVTSESQNVTTYSKSTSGGATVTLTLGLSTNVQLEKVNNLNQLISIKAGGATRFEGSTANPVQSVSINVPKAATFSGTVTAGDTLTITVKDAALSGGQKSVSYVVQGGDTLSSVASAIATAINNDVALQAINVSAAANGAVLTLTSTSANGTTYSASTNTGATESIALNETVGSSATLKTSQNFVGNPVLESGPNSAAVKTVSGGGTATTNTYPVAVNALTTQNLTYDANGNMTSDGSNSFAWDAENRLIKITYPGTNNFTDMTYNGLDRCVKIVETTNGSVTSTRQYVWCGSDRCDERDGSGNLTRQFFALGQRDAVTPACYFYTKDGPPGSVRDMTDSSGAIQAQFSYSPWGEVTKLQGSLDSDFGFARYFRHQPSGLNLTLYRAYSATLGRWLSRDPVGEDASPNVYAYVENEPISLTDPLGLISCDELRCKIDNAMDDLRKRKKDILRNRRGHREWAKGQFTKALQTVLTHLIQYKEKQKNLNDLLDEYEDLGCTFPLPIDTGSYLNDSPKPRKDYDQPPADRKPPPPPPPPPIPLW